MTRRAASGGLSIIAVVFLLAICAASIWLANGAFSFPAQAARLYGPPVGALGLLEKITVSYQLVRDQDLLLESAFPNAPEQVFVIEPDEPAASILSRLEAEGLIPSAAALRTFLIYSGWDTRLQPGEYRLSAAQAPVVLAAQLLDSSLREVPFGVLPGWRLEEIAASLPTSGLQISPDDFIAAANTRPGASPISTEIPFGVSLEGFLFPGVYLVPRETDAADLVLLLLNAFDASVTPDLGDAWAEHGLSIHEAVILASIVEREAVIDSEKPFIASVFLNRLAIGMKLDADPTVQYAVGYNASQSSWWTNPLTFEHLAIDSPYNTYLYSGLPPSPIANPDLASLSAVAFPESSPYYYFRAACDGSGSHVFSVSHEEHIAKACP
ncbi:MAG: endolytic transglycosylase MltG [Anaerolineae bacterium]|nr:MAG: endolytic transglycosylase MltG [Anaerolineae bacterium]